MTELISEFKSGIKDCEDRYELLIILNIILVNKVIDKINKLEKLIKEKI